MSGQKSVCPDMFVTQVYTMTFCIKTAISSPEYTIYGQNWLEGFPFNRIVRDGG